MLDIRKEFRINKHQQELLNAEQKRHKKVYKRSISEGTLLRYAIENTYKGGVEWLKNL